MQAHVDLPPKPIVSTMFVMHLFIVAKKKKKKRKKKKPPRDIDVLLDITIYHKRFFLSYRKVHDLSRSSKAMSYHIFTPHTTNKIHSSGLFK